MKKGGSTISSKPVLRISELFYDTIQGEGPYTGYPAVFLRLQGCGLNCTWCDTTEIWKHGHGYSFAEIFEIIKEDDNRLIHALSNGAVLVLTGGSPLLQQEGLIAFIDAFIERYKFKPIIHVENECIYMPLEQLLLFVDVWINSPKLINSLSPEEIRYQPKVLVWMSMLPNSWFKFVVTDEADWDEIEEQYINEGLIKREQVILMPQGISREEVLKNEAWVVQLAIEKQVKYSTRLQVLIWDRQQSI